MRSRSDQRTNSSLAQLDAIEAALLPEAIGRLVSRLLELRFVDQAEPPGERLLSPDEVAALLGVHRRWVYNNSDKLGAVKLSRRKLRIRESALRAYLNGKDLGKCR